MINEPIYCITSDIDWASSYCISDFMNLMQSFEILPTLFATHDDPIVNAYRYSSPNEVGIHPNFRIGSSHGADLVSVVNYMFKLFPNSKSFRSHAFYDSSDILLEMSKRGIRYDSNLCLYLQSNIIPLKLGIPGITRFPVFWEDDVHWLQTGGNWNVQDFKAMFTSPGLKIINVHPFIIAANIPSGDYYSNVKKHITTLSHEEIDSIRYQGQGPRTFLIELINFLKNSHYHFYTLHDLYRMFVIDNGSDGSKQIDREK